MTHSSQGFLVTCVDPVIKEYILFLHKQANSVSGDDGATSAAAKKLVQQVKKKRRTNDNNNNDNDDNDNDNDDDNDFDDSNDASDDDAADIDDTSFFRHVQIVQLDETHLFLTGAPLSLQAKLQRQVDLLHDRHTYSMEGADIRDNKFKLTAATVSKDDR
jgi:hypothetical protein